MTLTTRHACEDRKCRYTMGIRPSYSLDMTEKPIATRNPFRSDSLERHYKVDGLTQKHLSAWQRNHFYPLPSVQSGGPQCTDQHRADKGVPLRSLASRMNGLSMNDGVKCHM
ncbi:hypothetical protein PISMIDRAFT_327706 [Pisolithus microcarpus 441]|uniref:Uncharacterized protein n=1 Tax=Pisolithus microcarpus 441 TaxID=765257 RepID=A0A0D0A1D6_9AGAM|nr:hypothetical protein PISMIDRAFT_327706 [Pisolithus microcarpus 441]